MTKPALKSLAIYLALAAIGFLALWGLGSLYRMKHQEMVQKDVNLIIRLYGEAECKQRSLE